ncbi:CAP domain-containing protein [Planctomicrobium sp. SH664]|uniref:CAP domain-containing protein n=1 Tax=Planctomicrobium sp. SH664 TaxID=3448125 RepID=UPI003F5BE57A
MAFSFEEPPAHQGTRQLTSQDFGPYRPTVQTDISRSATIIREQTNRFRKSEKRSPLGRNEQLDRAAQSFAEFMARTGKYGHEADDQQPSQRLTAAGYDSCLMAENIGFLFKSTGLSTGALANGFITGWKNSPPHRANMLQPDVTEIGVGVAQSRETGIYFGVQLFARPKSAMVEFQVANDSPHDIRYRAGDEEFTLPPRFRRTHAFCKEVQLTLVTESPAPAEPLTPHTGERFRVEETINGLVLLLLKDEIKRP